MSVIGISPSDIVGGVRVATKAIGALKSGTGAQAQYQESKQSHDELHTAAQALSATFSSLDVPSAASLGQSFDQLLKTHQLRQKDMQKYEEALGQGSSSKKTRGIPQKLRWVFHGDKELRESDARNRPAVDAAILRTLQ
ncbi:hypothetical protein AYL99_05421 [Fonsecaea erecta]|uniref:Uncharacterized protein n=1 Tax=Fonsecaea erecta TaxID=1367422 RepID=A0A178ZKV1_9EURO|nr:hypothetical protein AYL99_05421 [Fonsecaea erecta]OAP60419.1 hypothetical protein AYL99_05421 [Fonsecaea erecta]